MLKYFLKIFVTGALALIICANETEAQPGHRTMERINLIKKIKMLEELQLDDATWKKFNDVHNEWEKKLQKQREKMKEAMDELNKAVKDNKSESDIKTKSENFMKVMKETMDMEQKRLNAIKAVLSDVEFAKFLVFEHKFREKDHGFYGGQERRQARPERKKAKRQ